MTGLPSALRGTQRTSLTRGRSTAWRSRRVVLTAGALCLLVASILAATSIGVVAIGPGQTARILLAHFGAPIDVATSAAMHDTIIWEVRFPRVLLAGVVGAALSGSGATYQAVFRNPLADPYLIGVASGAALGASIAILSPLPVDFYGVGYVALFAFVGAMLAVGLTYELAHVGRTVPPVAHVLAGVAVSAAAGAGTSLLMTLSNDRLLLIFAWIFGDFSTASWTKFWAIMPYAGVAFLVLIATSRHLNVLQLGDEEAQALGVPVQRVKVVSIVTASLAAAAAVAVAGVIGFVGLVVPHACRMLAGPDHRVLLPLSMLGGAILLIWADLAARTVIAPQELPVGVLTACLGAPFFMLLLRRQRRMDAS